jgi:hypothetical protein
MTVNIKLNFQTLLFTVYTIMFNIQSSAFCQQSQKINYLATKL